MDTETFDFYATHSPFTDPHPMAPLLDGMPRDSAGIQRVARGLVGPIALHDVRSAHQHLAHTVLDAREARRRRLGRDETDPKPAATSASRHGSA